MRKIDKSEKISMVTALVQELMELMNAKKCLKVAISNFSVFETTALSFQVVSGIDWATELNEGDQFDFILGDLPFGMNKKQDYKFGVEKLKIRQNWVEILKSLKFLNKNGMALFLAEPSCFGSSEGSKLEDTLNLEGYFVNAIFNAPEGILLPETLITPVFVLITKKHTESVFLAELLSESQSLQVAKNYYSRVVSSDLSRGIKIGEMTFYGFHRVKIKQQIEKLETQYKNYKEYSIGEIAKEIHYVTHGDSLVEKENSIYIPKIGNSSVVTKISDTTIKHHNYFQVVLGEKAVNEYVAAFFKSDLGKLVLQSLTSGVVIPYLNKRDLEQATVALPSFDVQEQILTTQRKLGDLKTAINSFDGELALNPTSSISILDKLDSMLESIGVFTDIDKIRSVIRQGESDTIEFKETLSLNVRTKERDERLIVSSLKTIVAFLNTKGGFLLVGVKDDGTITGLDTEINKFNKNSKDNFLLRVKDLIKNQIGLEFFSFIEYRMIQMNGNNILLVECKSSHSQCYLSNPISKKKEFYVRTNPASEQLEGPELVEYVQNHFNH